MSFSRAKRFNYKDNDEVEVRRCSRYNESRASNPSISSTCSRVSCCKPSTKQTPTSSKGEKRNYVKPAFSTPSLRVSPKSSQNVNQKYNRSSKDTSSLFSRYRSSGLSCCGSLDELAPTPSKIQKLDYVSTALSTLSLKDSAKSSQNLNQKYNTSFKDTSSSFSRNRSSRMSCNGSITKQSSTVLERNKTFVLEDSKRVNLSSTGKGQDSLESSEETDQNTKIVPVEKKKSSSNSDEYNSLSSPEVLERAINRRFEIMMGVISDFSDQFDSNHNVRKRKYNIEENEFSRKAASTSRENDVHPLNKSSTKSDEAINEKDLSQLISAQKANLLSGKICSILTKGLDDNAMFCDSNSDLSLQFDDMIDGDEMEEEVEFYNYEKVCDVLSTQLEENNAKLAAAKKEKDSMEKKYVDAKKAIDAQLDTITKLQMENFTLKNRLSFTD